MGKRNRVRPRTSYVPSNQSLRTSSSSGSTRSQKIAWWAKRGFIAAIVLFLLSIVVFQILAYTLPSPDKIVRHSGYSTKILDRNGKLLYDVFVDERRTPVTLAELPDYLKKATIAIEDKNFYQHQGFDPTGYLRILYNLVAKRRLIGGSTLSQQLVKNVLLSPERTPIRKLNELVITIQIEKRYSKDEILTLYFNEVPYGGTAWGVATAAQIYFAKNVKDLNLVESAFLAGLPQSPSRYSPYSSTPKAYIGRTEEVLRRMREDGYITADQEKEAKAQLPDLAFQSRGADFKAPHFVQYVQNILNERYGENVIEQGGLKVTTTLDLDLHEKAQAIVSEEIQKVQNLSIGNGAAVVINPETGEILSMVGSKDFNAKDYDGQVNVTTASRQPGSAIKPIVYAKALEKGYTASSLLADVPTSFPGGSGQPDYTPVNYDGKYRGPIQMRYSLANSMNVPAVKTIALVGVKDVLSLGYDMGLTSLEPTNTTLSRVGLSMALGGGEVKLLELTSSYSAFLNGGYHVEPVSILKVESSDGKVLENNTPKKDRQVLPPGVAFIIANILSDNDARKEVFGLNSLLNIPGRQVAVKTGTTNDKRDNWAVGGTPQVIVGTWVGNNDNSVMKSVASGVSGASPIWNRIVKASLEGKPVVNFTQPDSVVTAQVDKISGMRATSGFESRNEFFVKGTEPGEDTVHVKIKVCKNDGKLATPSDIAANNYDEREFVVLKEEDPLSGAGGENKWQKGILDWVNALPQPDAGKYKPPTEYCSGVNNAPLNVEFVNPRDRMSDLDNNVTIKFSIDGVNQITDAKLEIDGNLVRSFTSAPYEFETVLPTGVHTLRAIGKDDKGNQSDRSITIGINKAWDAK